MGNPSLYLSEVCHKVRDVLQVNISSTVHWLFVRYGITRKNFNKLQCRDAKALEVPSWHSFLLKREMLVCVDETGSDRTHLKIWLCSQGTNTVVSSVFCRGIRVNATAAITQWTIGNTTYH